MQQQLQVKVVSLQQTQDRLEDRARQHRQLQDEHTQQASELVRVTAELDSSKDATLTAERQLNDKTAEVSGKRILPFHAIARN